MVQNEVKAERKAQLEVVRYHDAVGHMVCSCHGH